MNPKLAEKVAQISAMMADKEIEETQPMSSKVESRDDSPKREYQPMNQRLNQGMISKVEWQWLMDVLKTFGFDYPGAVINHYGAHISLEAAKRTIFAKPRCSGAYFRTVAKKLNWKKIA